jgi:integrase
VFRLGVPEDAPVRLQLWGPQGLSSRFHRRGPDVPTVATLYKRGDAYYLNWREGGQQFRRSLGSVERREAEALRAEKEAELHGLITPTRGVTVGVVLDDYMAWYRTARPTTYKRAVSALKRFREAHDHLAAESLPAKVIERWAAAQAAQGQAEKALKLSRAAFRKAVAQRVIARSPMEGVTIPKSVTSRAPPYYRREQLRELARQPRGAAWIFMAATGLRRGEMVKARRSDARDGVLVVESLPEGRTKSGKWRAVPLNPYARAALHRLGEDRLIACHADTLGDWFKADATAAGLPGTLHWLRHTFCTSLAQSGVSLHDIKQLAGHSSVSVTEIYAHHQPSYGRAAVATMGGWGRKR